jgi:hypothetical protein
MEGEASKKRTLSVRGGSTPGDDFDRAGSSYYGTVLDTTRDLYLVDTSSSSRVAAFPGRLKKPLHSLLGPRTSTRKRREM